MIRTVSALSLVVIGLAYWADQPQATIAADPPAAPLPDYFNRTANGRVTAISSKGLTILSDDGTVTTFVPCAVLARGELPTAVSSYAYCWSDVCVGDKVDMFTSRVGGVLTCDRICILRRPGGLVPPTRGVLTGNFQKWHEIANAAQAEEEGREVPKPKRSTAKSARPPIEWRKLVPSGVFMPPVAPPPRAVVRGR